VNDDPHEGVSPDLPYELQSKLFEQLAAVSLGGAGLTVTLIGSVLRSAHGFVWLPVIEFGVAACNVANIGLIQGLLEGVDRRAQSKWLTALAVLFMAMGTGSLATAVYIDARHSAAPAKTAVQAQPATR
jgi:hypothetical protein